MAPSKEQEELVNKLKAEIEDLHLVAQGIKHYDLCSENAASGGGPFFCQRCRAERAEATLKADSHPSSSTPAEAPQQEPTCKHTWKQSDYHGHPYLVCVSCHAIDPMWESQPDSPTQVSTASASAPSARAVRPQEDINPHVAVLPTKWRMLIGDLDWQRMYSADELKDIVDRMIRQLRSALGREPSPSVCPPAVQAVIDSMRFAVENWSNGYDEDDIHQWADELAALWPSPKP